MGKVTCKHCQKTWSNLAEYLRTPNCGNPLCAIPEDRNQQPVKEQEVRKPPHISLVKKEEPKVPQVPLRVVYREADVLSEYDPAEKCLEVESPLVICIDIHHAGKKNGKNVV